MYGVAGERNLERGRQLAWLPGYEGSKPVRIGNAASDQYQLDVYGEVIGALHEARRTGLDPAGPAWDLELVLMDFIETGWKEPDDGIWEVRGPRRHFTHSKVEAWVAVDRAIHDVEDFGLHGPGRQMEVASRTDPRRGVREGLRLRAQHFYAVLRLQRARRQRPYDPACRLPARQGSSRGRDGRCHRAASSWWTDSCARYDSERSEHVDGLSGREGAFLPCSFWMVDDLHLIGRHDEAVALFERLLSLRNDLGLLAEEYDPVAKRLVGNFPQAFSHVSLGQQHRRVARQSARLHPRAPHRPRQAVHGRGLGVTDWASAPAPSAGRLRSTSGPAGAAVSLAADMSGPGAPGASRTPVRECPAAPGTPRTFFVRLSPYSACP